MKQGKKNIQRANQIENNFSHTRLQKLRLAIQANQQGLKIFKIEKNRLDQIETIWSLIEQQQQEEPELAAQKYHAEDTQAWILLSRNKQLKYKEYSAWANDTYRRELVEEKHLLDCFKQQLEERQARANRFLVYLLEFITGQREITMKLLQEDQLRYEKRIQAVKEKEEALDWGMMGVSEREQKSKNYIQQKLIERDNQNAKKVEAKATSVKEIFKKARAPKDSITFILQQRIIGALEGNYENPGATYCYNEASVQEKKKGYRAARAWREAGRAREAEVMNLEQENQLEAESAKKIAEEKISEAKRLSLF